MIKVLIASNNIDLIKKLVNDIMKYYKNIRIEKITTDDNETIHALNNENIDIAFFDIKTLTDVDKILSVLKDNKKHKYKNSIIIISQKFEQIENVLKNDMIVDYIIENSTKDEIIYKVNQLISNKDIEGKREQIIKELEYIRYNVEYKGTNYLIDAILQAYMNKNPMLENLQKEIYPIIADKYNKSINTIRCNIRHATECMYYECDIKRLKEYFRLIDDEKPTTKEVIYTVLNKIS